MIDPSESVPIGRRERRKIATRSELVRAGRELFSRKGLYEARVEDLAGHAGIGKGTVYLYFSGKEELAQAVVEAGFDELGRRASAAAENARTFPATVDQITRAHLEFFAANPDLMRVFHQVRGVLKFHRPEWLPLRKPLERHMEHIARLLARAPSPVRHRPAQRRTIALIIFGAVSGASSVRAALDRGPGAQTWLSLLRRGVTTLGVELAGTRRSGGRARPRGPGQ